MYAGTVGEVEARLAEPRRDELQETALSAVALLASPALTTFSQLESAEPSEAS
jgi:hypothetical protein